MPQNVRIKNDGDGEQLLKGLTAMPGVMSQMGFEKLREGQFPVIQNIMKGKDTMCILPTGIGKTATFVIPTLCLGWKTMVFSPLIALMRDQLRGLWEKGIPAGAINSNQSDAENRSTIQAWVNGELSFIYVAPERLDNAFFMNAVRQQMPDQVVLDEAHTLSQWSDSFRPAYRRAGDFISEYQPKVVSTFTATCPKEVEVDIRRVLGIPNADKLVYYPRRENLDLKSFDFEGLNQIEYWINKANGPSIVYCATVREVETLASQLSMCLKDKEVACYHGRMRHPDRKSYQDLFMQGEIDVIVATNAFGMGVDKPDIRLVIHRDVPGSVEALAQEQGRGGRDGGHTYCITLFDDKSFDTQQFFVDTANPTKNDIIDVYRFIEGRVDSKGELKMTNKEIAEKCGVAPQYVTSVFSVLKGCGVIDRKKNEDKIVKIKFEVESANDKKFDSFRDIVRQYGILTLGDYYDLEMEVLAENVGVTEQTIKNYLNKWAKEKWLTYVAPYKGSITVLTGALNMVDFDRLKDKAQRDYAKLEKVREYHSIPDEEKHDFLEEYFLGMMGDDKESKTTV